MMNVWYLWQSDLDNDDVVPVLRKLPTCLIRFVKMVLEAQNYICGSNSSIKNEDECEMWCKIEWDKLPFFFWNQHA